MEVLRKLLDSPRVIKGSEPVSSNPAALSTQRGKSTSIFSLLSYKGSYDKWIVDSGASDHMTSFTIKFMNYKPCKESIGIVVANGSMCKAAGRGDMKSSGLKLNSVLYVPNLKCNLLSVSKITNDLNCSVTFFPSCCKIQDLTSGRTIGNAEEKNGLYYLSEIDLPLKSKSPIALSIFSDSNVQLWHNQLGHPSFSYLKYLLTEFFINKDPSLFHCDYCVLAKQSQVQYSPQPYKPSKPFHLIHSDVWDPSRVPNLTGGRWFVTFIDDHTRVCWVYLMREKSEVSTIFKQFHKSITNIFQSSIHILRTDNGREYFSEELNQYLVEHGILHQSSCTSTPQQNGVAERKTVIYLR